jgi:N-methylhydantoinase A/oxoprolinase/acetone carboxylase beta subunit
LAIRIGIDVGGTFTDIVAVDAATRELIASVKVSTSHSHADGVASGIVTGLRRLLDEHAIDPASIAFIAHSTTQATNALLEGDVARVGVVTLGGAAGRFFAHFAPFALAEGVRFAPRWFDGRAVGVLDEVFAGVDAIAVSAPFGVDYPEREAELVGAARARGMAATSGAEVATQYGLRARTRTAALNAAILPRMLRTARMTAAAVADARIPAPLMIMRSDGGVMDVAEVERRPILTMLSGPAAGIAGALLHENVTDGIFIEVGGTSADCSVIRRGQPQMRPARIGGHRTLLRTLDVRTIAVAGGSLARIEGARVVEVGPRSAHIAGYRYASFCSPAEIDRAAATLHERIASLRTDDGAAVAITPTCAANALGLVAPGSFAHGSTDAARAACALVGAAMGIVGDDLAHAILDRAADRVGAILDELIADYALDRAKVTLIGGGGAGSVLVPYAAQRLGFAHRIARNAEVISPLGVALALVRDVVERTIVDPGPADLARIRREAIDAAVASGAGADGVDVIVEIDTARNRVRATASGATALVDGAQRIADADEDAQRDAAALQLRTSAETLAVAAAAGDFIIFTSRREAAIVDRRGVVRLVLPGARVYAMSCGELAARLPSIIDDDTSFGDVGRALPDVYLLRGSHIAAFATMGDAAQIAALVADEVAGLRDDDRMLVLSVPRRA